MRSQPGAVLSQRQYRLHQQLFQDGPLQYWSAYQLAQGSSPSRKILQIPLPIYIMHHQRKQQFQSQETYTALQNTPHVMEVEFVELSEEPAFLAFCPPTGQNLKQLIQSSKHHDTGIPWELAVYIVTQVCLGLHQAHSTPDAVNERPFILHGDLRPESLFLTETGNIQLLPFNQLHLWGDLREAWPNAVKRRYAYAAPERWQDDGLESIDTRIDLFGVGVLLYELLTGHLPHDGTSVESVQKQILSPSLPSLRTHINHLPSRLEALIYQLIHPSCNERPDTAGELAQTLVQLLERDRGVEGYQKQLASFYKQLAKPFEPTPAPESSFPTQGTSPTIARQKPTPTITTPPVPAELNLKDTAVTAAVTSDRIQTTNNFNSATMSNKDPFSSTPGQTPSSPNLQQPEIPETPTDPGSTSQDSGPFAPISPFLNSPPPSQDVASMKEVDYDYDPTEATMIDSQLIRDLRKSIEAHGKAGAQAPTQQMLASEAAPQVPPPSPTIPPPAPKLPIPPPQGITPPSVPLKRKSSSSNGRFQRYTPPSQDAFEATENEGTIPHSTENNEFAHIRPRPITSAPTKMTGPPATLSKEETSSSEEAILEIGTEFILEEDDSDTAFAPQGLVIPTSPPSPPASSSSSPAHFAHIDDDEDDGDRTAMAPPGSFVLPPGPTQQSADLLPSPPPPTPPPPIPNLAGTATPAKPRQLDAPPTLKGGPSWSPPTLSDDMIPTHSSSKGAATEAVHSFQAEDDDDDATMLQAPIAPGESVFSFSTQQNPGVGSQAPVATSRMDPPQMRSQSLSAGREAAAAPHSLKDLSQTPSADSLFGATPKGFDPAQPLSPSMPHYKTESSGALTTPESFDYHEAKAQHAPALSPLPPKKKGVRWVVPFLLLLLVGGGSAASVLTLGWPPWKGFLEQNNPGAKQPQRKKKKTQTNPKNRSLDGIFLNLDKKKNSQTKDKSPSAVLAPNNPEKKNLSALSNGESKPQTKPPLRRQKVKPRKAKKKTAAPKRRKVRRRKVRRRKVRRRKVRRRKVRRRKVRRRKVRRRIVRRRKVQRRKVAALRGGANSVQVSIQPRCTLYKGRRNLGKSYPSRSLRLPPGTHRLRCVNRSKKIIHYFSLLVVRGQATRYTRKLRAGKMLIRAKPWATIFVRGLGKVGKTGQVVKIYEGRHRVTLYKEGSKVPAPGNPKKFYLVVRPRKTVKPALIVFPVLDDD